MINKTIVFDLDGTLVDSVSDIALAVSKALEFWGFQPDLDYLEPASGFLETTHETLGYGLHYTTIELAKKIIKDWDDMPAELISHGIKIAQKFYIEHPIVLTKAFDGVLEMLEMLVAHNITISILSNKDDIMVQEVTQKLFGTFPWYKIAGALSINKFGKLKNGLKKPDAKAFFNVVPDDTLKQTVSNKLHATMVGDLDVDVQTAINANVPFYGAGWGYYKTTIKAPIHIVFDTPQDLANFVVTTN